MYLTKILQSGGIPASFESISKDTCDACLVAFTNHNPWMGRHLCGDCEEDFSRTMEVLRGGGE